MPLPIPKTSKQFCRRNSKVSPLSDIWGRTPDDVYASGIDRLQISTLDTEAMP